MMKATRLTAAIVAALLAVALVMAGAADASFKMNKRQARHAAQVAASGILRYKVGKVVPAKRIHSRCVKRRHGKAFRCAVWTRSCSGAMVILRPKRHTYRARRAQIDCFA